MEVLSAGGFVLHPVLSYRMTTYRSMFARSSSEMDGCGEASLTKL